MFSDLPAWVSFTTQIGQINKGRKLPVLNSAPTEVTIYLNEIWAKFLILGSVKLLSLLTTISFQKM